MPPKSTKRKASTPPPSQPTAKKAKQLIVPVDESFQNQSLAPRVYIDEGGVIFDAALNQSNITRNNNKFYRIQLIQTSGDGLQYWCTTRWGRVGKYGDTQLLGPSDLLSAKRAFEKKFKDKTGHSWENRDEKPKDKKYTYLEREYDEAYDADEDDADAAPIPSSEAPTSKLPPAIQSLLKMIFSQTSFEVSLQSIGYDSTKLPLGKLGKSTRMKAFEYLKEIETLVEDLDLDHDNSDEIEDLSNKYYSLIPHVTPGIQRLPLINTIERVQAETEMVDTLGKMEASNDIMEAGKKKLRREHAEKMALLDQHLESLNLDEITPVPASSTEYEAIVKYLVKSAGHTHAVKYKVQDIFRIRRHGEWERFEQAYGNRQTSCRRLLWHGSLTSNYGGILSQGLRIAPPEAPVSGYMFDKGIYLADASSKSSQYCRNMDGPGLLLLCEAELGTPTLRLTSADYRAADKVKANGYISCQGLGVTTPVAWVDAAMISSDLSGVLMPNPNMSFDNYRDVNLALQYNEYIVYDPAQVRLRYLIRFENEFAY